MKSIEKLIYLLAIAFFFNCGENKKTENVSYGKTDTQKVPASERVDLKNKGVGPITSVDLPLVVDEELAKNGEEVYSKLCLACHMVDQKFIGPSPKGILKRRSPEWVMNMIINPEKMVKEDPLAKDLLEEYNGSPMVSQNVSKEEARAILEYFRTL
ncbi:c-type cytochrome [Winogradskyella alexanderae]|uniref:Cytochrome c n=1 Tax=Winogradskyella alexanderae TaxID=2877123 RepID=A0ABS7XM05_9FLAO|nr:c-type cytochrome [Winogradskyella alexanderae]MCA0131030.1 cytochrome c [Winogradskyella alexanderae]